LMPEGMIGALYSEAREVLSEVSTASWWTSLLPKKRLRSYPRVLLEEFSRWSKEFKGVLKKRMGAKVYGSMVFELPELGAAAALLAEVNDGFRILYFSATQIAELDSVGLGKTGLPMRLQAYYGILNEKYLRIYDVLLPRIKRRIKSVGVWYIKRRSFEPGEFAPGASTRYGREEILVGKPKQGAARLRLYSTLDCILARSEFVYYKAKYVVFIPPVIAWKWTKTMLPVSTYDGTPVREVCP